MPVSFLNEEQERRCGRYAGDPAPEQLARYFHLDDADRAFVAGRRGAHMRLGFAVQLGTVRFLGTFLEQPADVPAQAVVFMASQLGIQAAGLLAEYEGSEWRWNYPTEIRDRYNYRSFSEPVVQFRLNHWLYALCWTGSDRPGALFDRATAWLIAHKVLLPGVTTLERNIARVRPRVAQRLWRQMLTGITDAAALTLRQGWAVLLGPGRGRPAWGGVRRGAARGNRGGDGAGGGAGPAAGRPYLDELLAQHGRVRRFLPGLARVAQLGAAPAAKPLLAALADNVSATSAPLSANPSRNQR